ncbi:uncharacterized protein yc1106_02750 [Curvularia clavata]|uniref:Uncharacterized protein n=1 Tax=Curvularia clavata TaxID=95742 RepID=A0A9Q8Z3C6_CURCL|nr:uncharacterized protein yc1106_02750 [Curvularia clavata]
MMPTEYDCQPLSQISSFITGRSGARFEAELFAVLFECPFVIRSFEFAPADGAIFATTDTTPPIGTFGERFWQLNEHVRRYRHGPKHSERRLVLFDAKSKISGKAEDQIYKTSVKQQNRVAFYIGICAANPDYVELIPNYRAGTLLDNNEKRNVAVNISRKPRLPPSAYDSLSPCNSPYRMPIRLLPEALARIQRCAQGQGAYSNPWTRVTFHDWIPSVEHDNDGLMPEESSQHFTSFRGLVQFWKGIRAAKWLHGIPMDFDFMWLQPHLADFKLLVPDSKSHNQRRQLFVQYKIDAKYRSPASPLAKVAIARNGRNGEVNYYFNDYERFDYLLYQFDYQDRQKLAWTQFFFLPESVLPDEFYTTEAKDASFDREDFKPYRIALDDSGDWVKEVYNIIQTTPNPRQIHHRPRRRSQNLFKKSEDEPKDAIAAPPTSQLDHFTNRLFYTITAQCAVRRSGLLIVLSRGHPFGDLAYCRYRWTESQKDAFLASNTPPCTITQLPPNTPVVPIHLYSRSQEGTSRGPRLTTAEFQRLNQSPQDRLLIFDIFNQDGLGLYSPLLVIPTSDISPTHAQQELYTSNRKLKKDADFEERVPLLAELIHTGFNPADYIVGSGGPRILDNRSDAWSGLWVLLDKFAGINHFTHPCNYNRRPSNFRVTIQALHQRLAEKHARMFAEPMPFVDVDNQEEDAIP